MADDEKDGSRSVRSFGSRPAEPAPRAGLDKSKLVEAPPGVGGCFIFIDGVRYWHPDYPVPEPVDSHGYSMKPDTDQEE